MSRSRLTVEKTRETLQFCEGDKVMTDVHVFCWVLEEVPLQTPDHLLGSLADALRKQQGPGTICACRTSWRKPFQFCMVRHYPLDPTLSPARGADCRMHLPVNSSTREWVFVGRYISVPPRTVDLECTLVGSLSGSPLSGIEFGPRSASLRDDHLGFRASRAC